jgi:hypothetical protein
MALPSPSGPRYRLKVPSTGKEISYRPFLVKEQKALLIAQQSEDVTTMIDTLKIVIESCIADKIKVDDLSVFDMEYIFTQLRAKSVGELVDLILKCDVCEDEKASVQYTIDLTKMKVDIPEGHIKTIPLYADVGVVMKYPSFEIIRQLENTQANEIDIIFNIVCMCIESIYEADEVHWAKDQKSEDLHEFIGNLTQDQFKKIQQFFETMPKLQEKVTYSCPVCKKEHNKFIRGIESFF